MRTHAITTVSELAFGDISKYLKDEILPFQRGCFSDWVVTPWHMNTKEIRRLNRELGISSLNYLGNTNYMYMESHANDNYFYFVYYAGSTWKAVAHTPYSETNWFHWKRK